MENKKNIRALTSVILAVLVAAACMPGLTFSSFGASVRRANKITKASQTKSKCYSTAVGRKVTLKYKLSPSKLPSAAKKVVWKSSNNKIVKISKVKSGSAVATFKSAGNATVTVRSRQNSRLKVTWKFSVLSADTATQLTGVTITAKSSSQDVAKVVQVGDTLRAITAPAGATATYQWYADGTAIKNATGSRYSASKKNVGKALSVKVSGTGEYAGEAESAATAKVTRTSSTSGSASVVIDKTPENSLPALKVTRVFTSYLYLNTTGGYINTDVSRPYGSSATGDVLRVTLDDSSADSKSVTADQFEIKWYAGTPGGSSTELTMEEPSESDAVHITAEEDGKFYQDYKIPSIPISVSKTFGTPTIYAVATGKADYEGSTSVSKPIAVAPASSEDSLAQSISYTATNDIDISSEEIPIGGGYTVSVDCTALTNIGLIYGKDYTIRWTVFKRVYDPESDEVSESNALETTGETFTETDQLDVDYYTDEFLSARIEGTGEYSGTISASELSVYDPYDINNYVNRVYIYTSDDGITHGTNPLTSNTSTKQYLAAVPMNSSGLPLDPLTYTVKWVGETFDYKTYDLGTGTFLNLETAAAVQKANNCYFDFINARIVGAGDYTGEAYNYGSVTRSEVGYLSRAIKIQTNTGNFDITYLEDGTALQPGSKYTARVIDTKTGGVQDGYNASYSSYTYHWYGVPTNEAESDIDLGTAQTLDLTDQSVQESLADCKAVKVVIMKKSGYDAPLTQVFSYNSGQ